MSAVKNILITSANSQTVISTIYSLRQVFYAKIITVDRKKNTLSKHLADVSVIIAGGDKAYLASILKLCKKHAVDVIIPQSISDRLLLMRNKELFDELNIPICSSSPESILLCDDKSLFAAACKDVGIPVPEQYLASTAKDLLLFAGRLGYPEKKVVVKPVVARGGRGFRILNAHADFKTKFYTEKGNTQEITIEFLVAILGKRFPTLIVSEYLPGKEYSVDCLRVEDKMVVIPRERVETTLGLTSYGKLVEHHVLIEQSKLLAEKLDLTTIFGFQFKEDEEGIPKILECNPRIQGTMIMSTLAGANLIAMYLKWVWKKKFSEPDIDWDLEYQRIWGGISIGEKKNFLDLDLR